MSYRGDIALGSTIDLKFTTRRFSTGAPYTLAGSPVISAYPDNSTTQITAGITLSVDFDGVTGLNNVRVVASGGNGFAAGSNYDLVITTGTVDSVSVVGEVIGSFSIEARSGLRPTTAGRTLDVSSGGEAGVDWANVGSPTTTLNLSGTTVKTATDVETDTQDIQSRLPAALVSGRMDSNVQATAAALTFNLTGNITGNLSGSVGSVTGNVGGNVAGTVASVVGNVGGNVVGSVASVVGAVGSVTSGVTVTTNNDKTGYSLTTAPPTANENADALLDRSAGVETGLTPRQALRVMAAALAGEVSGAGTTTETFRNAVADSKNRIVATCDSDGNRTAITYDLT